MKLPLEQFWMILWCWTTQVPVRQTVSITRLSEVTVRHWFEQFRVHLPADQDVLESLVQLDEACFGGKAGHTLLMAKQIDKKERRLAFQILTHTNSCREHAWQFLKNYIAPETHVNTDGAAIYNQIDQWRHIYHSKDIHKKFEFEQTSEIEGIFGVLCTFIRRMYHHVTVAKLEGHVREFCYRFSHPEMFENSQHILENTLFIVPTR